jgi:hypothetical protein
MLGRGCGAFSDFDVHSQGSDSCFCAQIERSSCGYGLLRGISVGLSYPSFKVLAAGDAAPQKCVCSAIVCT